MDDKTKSFFSLSFLLVFIFLLITVDFVFVYRYSTINTYSTILLIAIIMIIILMLFLIVTIAVVSYICKKEYAGKYARFIAKAGLKVLFPLITELSNLFKSKKDMIRSFFISLNNIVVQSSNEKYNPEDILLLLPHCLQKKVCVHKITNDIDNCKKCGKCCIGEIITAAQAYGIEPVVVTGGTVARSLVAEKKPRLIISVACERDLASGIADISTIPVVGIINDRPNGPCNDTSVDVAKLEEIMDNVVKICVKC